MRKKTKILTKPKTKKKSKEVSNTVRLRQLDREIIKLKNDLLEKEEEVIKILSDQGFLEPIEVKIVSTKLKRSKHE